jgi:hypothetical protein
MSMAIQHNVENGGKLLVIHITGKLVKANYERFVPELVRLVREHGKLRIPFEMSDFHGWEGNAMWEDLRFAIRYYADIDGRAMIGEKKWQHGMVTFCKPFTKAAVRYFDRIDAVEVRKWMNKAERPWPREVGMNLPFKDREEPISDPEKIVQTAMQRGH